MARQKRSSRPAVVELLQQHPQRFEFFQAVQLLENLSAGKDRATVGGDSSPSAEAIRFRSAVTASFPAAEIDSLVCGDGKGKKSTSSPAPKQESMIPCELTVNFMGLVGPQGTLPQHYTHLVVSRLHPRHKDETLKQFLDLFHHRSISLFFKAWQKHHLPASYEAAWHRKRQGAAGLFQFLLECFVGLGTPGLRERPAGGVDTVLGYAGHFSRSVRDAVSLEGLLRDWLQWPVDVLQFSGRWLPLPGSSRTYLPSRRKPHGQNLELGSSTIIGSRVWEAQSKFRVRIGPLTYKQFEAVMPNGSLFHSLCDLLRLYAGPEFDFDLQPLLSAAEIPRCELTTSPSGSGPFLGWNTWLSSQATAKAASEALFRPPPLN